MKKMIIVWIGFMVVMIGSLLYIGFQIEKQDRPYTALEKNLEEAAYGYLMANEISLSLNEKMKISLDTLVDANLINTTSVKEDDCEGYVIAQKRANGTEYNAYIKCQNYSSDNYEKN